MRVAITGASGFLGRTISAALRARGDAVVPVGRNAGAGGVRWDPDTGTIDAAGLEGLDAVIHLAGENLNGRWTAARKRRIRESRIKGTSLLAKTLAGLQLRPATLISASAVGYYGAHGDEEVDESAPPGKGFLATVCMEWERAAAPAAEAGIRVVHPRLGVVMGRGGALEAMLLPFQLGLGGPIGSGEQFLSWVALEDVVGGMLQLLDGAALTGGVNLTAPNPVRFAELARSLGRVLHRPAFMRLPAFAARLVLGEMADEMLLTGARVLPRRLVASGYRFQYPEITGALRHALDRDV